MMSGLSSSSILTKNSKVIGQVVEHEVVLVLLEKNQVKVLNEVGSRIWELVDGERCIADIASIICTEFDVSQQESLDDTLIFLEELLFKGIVSVCS
jgi:hypothetical protein